MTSNSIRKDETGRLLFGGAFFRAKTFVTPTVQTPVWCAHAVGCSGVTLVVGRVLRQHFDLE